MLSNKIGRLWPRNAASSTTAARAADSLDVFGSEADADPSPALHVVAQAQVPAVAPARPRRYGAAATLAVCALALAVSGAYWWGWLRPLAAHKTGSLTINTDPAGVQVFSGGQLQGQTPLALEIGAGEHTFELVRGDRRQPLRAVVQAGATVVHHVQFEAAPAIPSTGTLQIATVPSGVRVVVDSEARGASPLTLSDLAAGTHNIEVHGPGGVVKRTVTVTAGQTASVIVSGPGTAAAPAHGWLAIVSGVPVHLLEKGEVVGTSDAARLMLPSGRHELELVNAAFGYRERRAVQIPAGGTATLQVQLPRAPLSINALPWAEVSMDGTPIGETPIGNRAVPIGRHEIVFRHPELGERRQTVDVTLLAPARVSVDMRKPKS